MLEDVNDLLRAAREAAGLSQDQLAECANLVCKRPGAMDGNYIGKLERGVHRWPNQDYRRALREVLGVAADADLGFRNTRLRTATVAGRAWEADGFGEVARVQRSEFLGLVAGLGVGAAFVDPARLAAAPGSGRIGASDVALVREVTVASRRLRWTYGGAACAAIVAGQVRGAVALLDRPSADPVRTDMHAAVGALACMSVGGEIDAGNPAGAHRHAKLALYCAQEAQSWSLWSEVLRVMGHNALYLDRADDALSRIELAQVRADRIPVAGRVLLGATHARALAATGRGSDAVDRLLRAEDQRDATTAAHAAPGSYFAEATALDVACDLATAAVEVAVSDIGFAPKALDRVQDVLDSPELAASPQTRFTALLADLALRAGEVERGLAAAGRVVALSESVSSALLTRDLRRLRDTLTRQDGPQARELAALLDARTGVAGGHLDGVD